MKRTQSQYTYPSSQKRTKYAKKTITKYTAPPSSVLRRMVKEEVLRTSETKMVSTYFSELNVDSVFDDIYSVPFPHPAQGPGSNERIGNKIKPTGLSANVLFNNNTSENLWVRYMILKINQATETDAVILDNLLEGFNGQDTAGDGSLKDLIRKINRETVVVMKDEIFELGGTGSGANTQTTSVATRKNYFKLKTPDMTFQDNVSNNPQNFRYITAYMVRRADGDEVLGEVIEVSYNLDFYYKE